MVSKSIQKIVCTLDRGGPKLRQVVNSSGRRPEAERFGSLPRYLPKIFGSLTKSVGSGLPDVNVKKMPMKSQ